MNGMQRYFLEVMYDGTGFHGSQIQGETPTVQYHLNKALSTILRMPVSTFGASRTDEGVHALCNFYHFDIGLELTRKVIYRLNAVLPSTMSVANIYTSVNPEMNARFDALTRQYRYRIYNHSNPFLVNRALYYPYKIDEPLLHNTAAMILTYTDFESFAKRNSQVHTFKCTILHSYWEWQGRELHYVVEANRFLRGMVRGLVGTQLKAARGGYDLDGFRAIIEAKDCTRAEFAVAGHGLYLEKIKYADGALIPFIS